MNRSARYVAICWLALSAGSARAGSSVVFGVPLIYEAPDAALAAKLEAAIRTQSAELSSAWDPDCYYRPLASGRCSPGNAPSETREIEALAAELKAETDGVFDVAATKRGKVLRDFGGMAQGYFLEKLRRKFAHGWKANFSGDIYLSPDLPEAARRVGIGDPLLPQAAFAEIEMRRGGWVFFSGGPSLGTALRGKPGAAKVASDFSQVIVVAKADFSGGRADAYATALIVGGNEMLKRLRAQKNASEWGAVIFPWHAAPACTDNLVCDFKDASRRRVAF